MMRINRSTREPWRKPMAGFAFLPTQIMLLPRHLIQPTIFPTTKMAYTTLTSLNNRYNSMRPLSRQSLALRESQSNGIGPTIAQIFVKHQMHRDYHLALLHRHHILPTGYAVVHKREGPDGYTCSISAVHIAGFHHKRRHKILPAYAQHGVTGCLCGRSPSSSMFSTGAGGKVASSFSAFTELFVVVGPSAFSRGRIFNHPKPSSVLSQ
jgi:hypothetical protein